ncbi:fascin domain-containing protein [Romboutsia sp. 1001713B170207_170306_H8]|uniref:fascin domain-containing protein n=1 Tax=Romboutsia sp. 1001713B170207_170306_H8 TaxID=2787112 RepID=UPI0018983D26|nr:hypothetical protein [Romboutsia sp. 1001713B170207_170306_H8]
MKNKSRMPILIVPGKGPIILPPYGPGPVMPPNNEQNQPGGFPNFPPIPNQSPNENTNRIIIKIKSVFNDKFVQVGANRYLYSIGEYFNDGQVFVMILLDRNQIKIRIRGGNFIRIDDKGFLIADTDNKGASIFNIYSTSQNEYVLLAPNGYYVRVRESDNMLVARAENAGARTRFKFRKVQNY